MIGDTSLTVIQIGTLYKGALQHKYWSSVRGRNRYPYPIGFQSTRGHSGRHYKQEVREGSDGPVFIICSNDGVSFSGDSPASVWEQAVKRKDNDKAKHGTAALQVNGSTMFGFDDPTVRGLLQQLENEGDAHGKLHRPMPPLLEAAAECSLVTPPNLSKEEEETQAAALPVTVTLAFGKNRRSNCAPQPASRSCDNPEQIIKEIKEILKKRELALIEIEDCRERLRIDDLRRKKQRKAPPPAQSPADTKSSPQGPLFSDENLAVTVRRSSFGNKAVVALQGEEMQAGQGKEDDSEPPRTQAPLAHTSGSPFSPDRGPEEVAGDGGPQIIQETPQDATDVRSPRASRKRATPETKSSLEPRGKAVVDGGGTRKKIGNEVLQCSDKSRGPSTQDDCNDAPVVPESPNMDGEGVRGSVMSAGDFFRGRSRRLPNCIFSGKRRLTSTSGLEREGCGPANEAGPSSLTAGRVDTGHLALREAHPDHDAGADVLHRRTLPSPKAGRASDLGQSGGGPAKAFCAVGVETVAIIAQTTTMDETCQRKRQGESIECNEVTKDRCQSSKDASRSPVGRGILEERMADGGCVVRAPEFYDVRRLDDVGLGSNVRADLACLQPLQGDPASVGVLDHETIAHDQKKPGVEEGSSPRLPGGAGSSPMEETVARCRDERARMEGSWEETAVGGSPEGAEKGSPRAEVPRSLDGVAAGLANDDETQVPDRMEPGGGQHAIHGKRKNALELQVVSESLEDDRIMPFGGDGKGYDAGRLEDCVPDTQPMEFGGDERRVVKSNEEAWPPLGNWEDSVNIVAPSEGAKGGEAFMEGLRRFESLEGTTEPSGETRAVVKRRVDREMTQVPNSPEAEDLAGRQDTMSGFVSKRRRTASSRDECHTPWHGSTKPPALLRPSPCTPAPSIPAPLPSLPQPPLDSKQPAQSDDEGFRSSGRHRMHTCFSVGSTSPSPLAAALASNAWPLPSPVPFAPLKADEPLTNTKEAPPTSAAVQSEARPRPLFAGAKSPPSGESRHAVKKPPAVPGHPPAPGSQPQPPPPVGPPRVRWAVPLPPAALKGQPSTEAAAANTLLAARPSLRGAVRAAEPVKQYAPLFLSRVERKPEPPSPPKPDPSPCRLRCAAPNGDRHNSSHAVLHPPPAETPQRSPFGALDDIQEPSPDVAVARGHLRGRRSGWRRSPSFELRTRPWDSSQQHSEEGQEDEDADDPLAEDSDEDNGGEETQVVVGLSDADTDSFVCAPRLPMGPTGLQARALLSPSDGRATDEQVVRIASTRDVGGSIEAARRHGIDGFGPPRGEPSSVLGPSCAGGDNSTPCSEPDDAERLDRTPTGPYHPIAASGHNPPGRGDREPCRPNRDAEGLEHSAAEQQRADYDASRPLSVRSERPVVDNRLANWEVGVGVGMAGARLEVGVLDGAVDREVVRDRTLAGWSGASGGMRLRPVASVTHPMPVLALHLGVVRGGDAVLAVCVGEACSLDRTFFLYKFEQRGGGQRREGIPQCSLAGVRQVALVERTKLDHTEYIPEEVGVCFTASGELLVLLEDFVPSTSNEVRSGERLQGDLGEGSLGTGSGPLRLMSVDGHSEPQLLQSPEGGGGRMRCLLLAEPSLLVAAGDNGCMIGWEMADDLRKSCGDGFQLPSATVSVYTPAPCITRLARVPSSPQLVLGCASGGLFALWDVRRRLLLSTFSGSSGQQPCKSIRSVHVVGLREVDGASASEEARQRLGAGPAGGSGRDQAPPPGLAVLLATSSPRGATAEGDEDGRGRGSPCLSGWIGSGRLCVGGQVHDSATAVTSAGPLGVAGSETGQVVVWDILSGKPLAAFDELQGSWVTCVTADLEASTLATASADGRVMMYVRGRVCI